MEVGAVWQMTFFDISPVEGGISGSFHQGSPDVLMEFIQTQWGKFNDEFKFLFCQLLEKIIVSWKTMVKKAGACSNTLESRKKCRKMQSRRSHRYFLWVPPSTNCNFETFPPGHRFWCEQCIVITWPNFQHCSRPMEFHKIFGCIGKIVEVLFLVGIMVELATSSNSHFQNRMVRWPVRSFLQHGSWQIGWKRVKLRQGKFRYSCHGWPCVPVAPLRSSHVW